MHATCVLPSVAPLTGRAVSSEGAKHFLSLVEVYFSAAQRFLCQITHVDLLRWTSELILVFFKAACSQL